MFLKSAAPSRSAALLMVRFGDSAPRRRGSEWRYPEQSRREGFPGVGRWTFLWAGPCYRIRPSDPETGRAYPCPAKEVGMRRRSFIELAGAASAGALLGGPGTASLAGAPAGAGETAAKPLLAKDVAAYLRSLIEVAEPSVDRIVIGDPETEIA